MILDIIGLHKCEVMSLSYRFQSVGLFLYSISIFISKLHYLQIIVNPLKKLYNCFLKQKKIERYKDTKIHISKDTCYFLKKRYKDTKILSTM